MNHASGTVAPLDPELIQVGDVTWQQPAEHPDREEVDKAN